MQSRADGQDTADSWSPSACAGSGVGSMRQRVPFHRSARATELTVPVVCAVNPTAVQAAGAGQEIPFRKLSALADGLGTCWITQWPPVRRSASGANSPALVT